MSERAETDHDASDPASKQPYYGYIDLIHKKLIEAERLREANQKVKLE
jgi:hypothetical protein